MSSPAHEAACVCEECREARAARAARGALREKLVDKAIVDVTRAVDEQAESIERQLAGEFPNLRVFVCVEVAVSNLQREHPGLPRRQALEWVRAFAAKLIKSGVN